MVVESVEHLPAKSLGKNAFGLNRGWFQRGHRRINREGRPHGTGADAPATHR
jgi:hypothetical protein